LEKTYFIHLVQPFSRNVDKEIGRRRKNFLADTGLLNQLAQVSSGQVFENQVFLQLMKRGDTKFYQRKSGQEIDFILNNAPSIEVKKTPHFSDLTTLTGRSASLSIPEKYLTGKIPPGDGFKDFIWAGHIF
jgi:predicted AAA+ superfamily ATPase